MSTTTIRLPTPTDPDWWRRPTEDDATPETPAPLPPVGAAHLLRLAASKRSEAAAWEKHGAKGRAAALKEEAREYERQAAGLEEE